MPDLTSLVHDWGADGAHRFRCPDRVLLQDETLREGLHSPTVVDPPIEAKVRLLHLMDRLGIDSASLGIPSAGPNQFTAVKQLCREIADQRLGIRPNCGGRTMIQDVHPMLEVRDATGVALEACLFIGSSPMRQLVEGWTIEQMVRRTQEAVGFAVAKGLEVIYITEDTTRSSPQHLRALLVAAIDAGARRLCLCDTAGAAIPAGVSNLVGWVTELIDELGADVGLDWHGHNDRGLGLANALAALEAGAERIHATALGLGERVGNTPMEILLVNLKLLGIRDDDLTALPDYVRLVSEATAVAIPVNAPIVGRDAFRTATGVHAAAVVKARRKGNDQLADRVYSAVPASWVGRRQRIAVGHLSGAANVRQFLEQREIPATDDLVHAVLIWAKSCGRVLTDAEVLECVQQHSGVHHD